MSVYLAVGSCKWGDDYRIYGVCRNKCTAIQKLLSAIRIEDVQKKLMTNLSSVMMCIVLNNGK
jgi:hypothetical protein